MFHVYDMYIMFSYCIYMVMKLFRFYTRLTDKGSRLFSEKLIEGSPGPPVLNDIVAHTLCIPGVDYYSR